MGAQHGTRAGLAPSRPLPPLPLPQAHTRHTSNHPRVLTEPLLRARAVPMLRKHESAGLRLAVTLIHLALWAQLGVATRTFLAKFFTLGCPSSGGASSWGPCLNGEEEPRGTARAAPCGERGSCRDMPQPADHA